MAKRRRFIYASGRSNSRRNIARGTAAAVILAAVIYFAVAGGLGTWLADTLIVPFMNRGAATPPQNVNSAFPPGVNTPEESPDTTPTPPPSVTEELTLMPLPFYSIQLGAFINQANAEAEARSIRERGAAGYIFTDADRYRVLASAYLSRADADKVSRQLLEQQGLENYVFEVYTDGSAVTLRITGTSERVGGMQGAIDAWRTSLDAIEEISRNLDMSEIGPELARNECRSVAERLIENRNALTGGAAVEGVGEPIEALGRLMDDEAASLLNISDNISAAAMEISAQIKYTYIDSLNRYGGLMRSMAQSAL